MSSKPTVGVDQQARGGSALLSEAVKRVLDEKGWSLRAAAAYTGLHANTIDRLAKGLTTETDSIIAFAEATAPKGDELSRVRHYLKLAGKTNITRLIDAAERTATGGGAEKALADMELKSPEAKEIVRIAYEAAARIDGLINTSRTSIID